MPSRVLAIALVCAAIVAGAIWWLVKPLPPAAEPKADAPRAAAPPPVERPAGRKPAAPASPSAPRREPAPAAPVVETTGTLTINSDVPGAQVFIDREFIGRAPVTKSNITPGPHRLNVDAEGFDGVLETIEVSPGAREIMIRLREVRLDAAIDVVHRHRIGSCAGRLVATAEGIRYETADREDAFAATLSELSTFEVDYANKNLRVEVRGKRFNFSDPAGNAEKLFVFHRDVSKARERLARGDTPAAN